MREDIIKLPPLYFKGCIDCVKCCDGSKFFLAPLILEDFAKVKDYFKIRAIVLDNIIPVMLFNNDGITPCKYLKNNKCEIYTNRPPACKLYPFSPYYNQIFIDIECDAVGCEGVKLPSSKSELIKSEFFDTRIDNFKEKREATIEYMKNKELIFDKEIKGIKLYKFEI